jgi:uncharacterized repeat protein (TIGR03803 family)
MKKSHFSQIVCVAAFCVASVAASHAQSFTTVREFGAIKGGEPLAPLIQGANGNLYGTTDKGGSDQVGTVFEVTTGGDLSLLTSFCLSPTCDGPNQPRAPLVQGADGNFYGTTEWGGPNSYGTVFKITPDGTVTTLYNFCSKTNCTDGQSPMAGLTLGINGNFYGTTYYGGAHATYQDYNAGTVFEITPAGQFTTLYSFCSKVGHTGNCRDGEDPVGGLVLGTDGNLYGTTTLGGDTGHGSVFKITPGGKLTTIYSFCPLGSSCDDGEAPEGTLVQAGDGNFYGTTYGGGSADWGTVFKLTPEGTLTTLHSFCQQTNCPDGADPVVGLALGTDGNFYGTTIYGGNVTNYCSFYGCGTAFQVTSSGTFTTLYSFCSEAECSDGNAPYGGLMQATNGDFYGTTTFGGLAIYDCNSALQGCGTVYSLSMGLGPFVEANPGFSRVGREVGILGNNLTGTTSVTFNGVAATFDVVSSTFIKATVPTGATTGPIAVVTPSGTLVGNVAFRVNP